MKRDRVNYFVVGVVVLAVGVAFLALLYRLTGSNGPVVPYYVYYDNVFGLKLGTGAFYQGYQVGQIEKITPQRVEGHTRFKVDLSVTRELPVPDDSIAAIISSGLLSGVSININEGKSTTMLAPGSEIKGGGQVNLFAALNDVAADFRELSHEGIMPALKNLNERFSALSDEYRNLSANDIRPLIASIKGRIDDPELFDQVKKILLKADDSTRRMQQLLGDENQQLVNSTLINVQHVSQNTIDLLNRVETTRLQMHHVVTEVDKLVASNSEKFSNTITNASGSSEDLHAAMADLRRSLQIISTNIDAIVYHLQEGSRNMHEFSREIRENPGLLLNGSPQKDAAAAKQKEAK